MTGGLFRDPAHVAEPKTAKRKGNLTQAERMARGHERFNGGYVPPKFFEAVEALRARAETRDGIKPSQMGVVFSSVWQAYQQLLREQEQVTAFTLPDGSVQLELKPVHVSVEREQSNVKAKANAEARKKQNTELERQKRAEVMTELATCVMEYARNLGRMSNSMLEETENVAIEAVNDFERKYPKDITRDEIHELRKLAGLAYQRAVNGRKARENKAKRNARPAPKPARKAAQKRVRAGARVRAARGMYAGETGVVQGEFRIKRGVDQVIVQREDAKASIARVWCNVSDLEVIT